MKNYFLIILCFIFVPDSRAQQDQRPNILWIVSEDNTTMLGCYGDEFATTPNIDQFAKKSILYENAFSGPACALSRSTLITGMLASSMGIENMRSSYPIPAFVKFFPKYLRDAGYYTTNNDKRDYNTNYQPGAWNESSNKATYKNRKPGQPFFSVFNLGVTHESTIHKAVTDLKHDPDRVPLPPYHPRNDVMKHDWAHYYDRVELMDKQVGRLLQELEDAGLMENTIVFYYSDNGGVLGRSKRFMYDSGLHVPLIIHFPERFAKLAPHKPGTRTDRVVSFEDFAPTVLSLAGADIPSYMKGTPFLGVKQMPKKEYAFGFRGRIDESLELVRTIRNKKFRYIRNYMPHVIYGQHNEYLWQAKSIVSWEDSFRKGLLNDVQSVFWNQKPAEELYDVVADPFNVNNLAGNNKYKGVLEKMRGDNREMMLKTKDTGFIPESMKVSISGNGTIYDFAQNGNDYPLERILNTAELGTTRDVRHLEVLIDRLNDKNPIVRYWAATGCTVLGKKALAARSRLVSLLKDPSPAVRIAASEALYHMGDGEIVIPVLTEILRSENQLERVEALTVLERMGPDAKAALPMISQMVKLKEDKKMKKLPLWKSPHDIKLAKRIISGF